MDIINVIGGFITTIVVWGLLVRLLFVMPHIGNFEWVKSWILVFGSLFYFVTFGLVIFHFWWVAWIIGAAILLLMLIKTKTNKVPYNSNLSVDDKAILSRREFIFKNKIDTTNDFLINKIMIENLVSNKQEQIDQYLMKYQSLTGYERSLNLRSPSIFFTTPQMMELKSLLELTKDEYVSTGYSSRISESSTIEYLIRKTEIFLSINETLGNKRIIMTIDTSVPNWTFNFTYRVQ